MKTVDQIDNKYTSWAYNVQDRFKPLSQNEIKDELKRTQRPFSVLMSHLEKDFNISCLFRSFNAFNGNKFFYYGQKKIDRRALCGSHNYSELVYLDSFDKVKELKETYSFIALENNKRTHFLHEFDWNTKKSPLLIVGEESKGLSDDILDLCEAVLEIPIAGSIRSFNVSVAGSLGMWSLCSKKYL